jgi:hypothetical protein
LKDSNANLKHKPILETVQKIYCKHLPNGLRYLRWGRGQRSCPARKRLRRVKLLGMCAESPASGARFVSVPDIWKTRRLKRQNTALTDLILPAPHFFTSPTLPLKTNLNLQNAEAENLCLDRLDNHQNLC